MHAIAPGSRENRGSAEPLLLFAVPILLCGCVAEDRRSEIRESAILDGALDHGDPAIVYLSMGNSACTGSVIDPRVVLTAKHCVEGVDASWVEVFKGDNPYGGGGETIASAGDITDIQVYDQGWGIEGVDIALLIAGRDLDVDPVPYLRDENLPSQGDLVEAAGYGQSDDWSSPDGNKRRGSGSITDNWGVEISTTPITCYGDSGGPLFDEQGVVIGITSRGTQEACSAGDDIYTNVGHFASWIADFVTNPAPLPGEDPGPGPDPEPGDDDPVDPGPGDDPGPDPGSGDDDPVDPGPGDDDPLPGDDPIDEGAGFGDACSEGEQCASNACVALGGEGYCTQSCAAADCPFGYECKGSAQGAYCFFDGAGGAGGGADPDGYAGLQSTCAAAPGALSTGGPGAAVVLILAGLLISLRRPRR
jgi:hypothetical protein